MAEEFDGFVNIEEDLTTVHEPQLLPTGRYHLTIQGAKATVEEDDAGNKVLSQISVRVSADRNAETNQPVEDAETIFHTIFLPKPTDPAEKRKNKVRFMKRFLVLFNIPFSSAGINPTDFVGRSAVANVNLDTYEKRDGSGTAQKNSIVLPSLPR